MRLKVQAAVFDAVDKVTVRQLDLGEPQTGEVLVKLVATGLCHTDLSVFRGHIPAPLPMVAGHEGAGVIAAVGPGVADLAPGDHVICSTVIRCGACYTCVHGGLPCETSFPQAFGGGMLDGTQRLSDATSPVNHLFCQSSFAEYAVVPAVAAVRVDPSVPLEKVASLGCSVGTGLGAVINRARITPGASVLVLGAGGVGLGAMLGARLVGAGTVIASDINAAKLAKAKRIAADHTIDTATSDLTDAVDELTEGRGVDYSIDAVGAPGTLDACFRATRPGGTCVAVGLMYPTITTEIDTFSLLAEKTLTGCYGGSLFPKRDIPAFVRLYQRGRLDLDSLLDAEFTLEQLGGALEQLEKGALTRGVVRF